MVVMIPAGPDRSTTGAIYTPAACIQARYPTNINSAAYGHAGASWTTLNGNANVLEPLPKLFSFLDMNSKLLANHGDL